MREILFKGKWTNSGEWVEGLLTVMWRQYHIINPLNESTAYPIDPETICQYTGLTDKNGKKIWENDIVKCNGKLVVLWDEKYAGWCLSKKGWLYNHYFGEACNPEDCENVGNIFDNPELLEGDAE